MITTEQSTTASLTRRGIAKMRPITVSIVSLMAFHWLLIIITNAGVFHLWWIALPLLVVGAAFGLLALLSQPRSEILAVAIIVSLSLVVYLPTSEHIGLSGDAAIYPNTGALIARSGGFELPYTPLSALSPQQRDLFFVSSDEQLEWMQFESYDGIVYGAYYITDLRMPTLHTSRQPLVETVFGFAINLMGVRMSFLMTGIFACLSLLALYYLSRMFITPIVAVYVAVLFGVTYPAIYFGRAPYSEMFGQFWTLVGFAYSILWIRTRRPELLIVAVFCWFTTWAARLDAFMLFIPLGILLLLLGLRRDRQSAWWLLGMTPIFIGMAIAGTNTPYARATVELMSSGIDILPFVLLGLPALALAVLPIGWAARTPIMRAWPRISPALRWATAVVSVTIAVIATTPTLVRELATVREYVEVFWYTSYYVTPLFFWLATAGVVYLIVRSNSFSDLYLAAVFVIWVAMLLAMKLGFYVYPVHLRRLFGNVLPLAAILVGIALSVQWASARYSKLWLYTRQATAAVLMIWMIAVSRPILLQHEGAGSIQFVENLHAALPANGVFLFERQDGDSWVGWLAAPLYSIYNDWALLLKSDEPDAAVLGAVVGEFEAAGRTVYVISQHDPLPEPLLPPGYSAQKVNQFAWRSSLIGQTREPVYPPPYWEFEHPLHVYELTRSP